VFDISARMPRPCGSFPVRATLLRNPQQTSATAAVNRAVPRGPDLEDWRAARERRAAALARAVAQRPPGAKGPQEPRDAKLLQALRGAKLLQALRDAAMLQRPHGAAAPLSNARSLPPRDLSRVGGERRWPRAREFQELCASPLPADRRVRRAHDWRLPRLCPQTRPAWVSRRWPVHRD
jgi:hypothetical protein